MKVLGPNSLVDQLIDEMEDGILLLSASGSVILANDAARLYCLGDVSDHFIDGWDKETEFFETTEERRLERAEYPHVKLLRDGSYTSTILKIVPNKGKSLIVAATGEAYSDGGGNMVGAILRLRDLAVRQHDEQIEKQNKGNKPNAADLELESFIYSVSHDLQAPLRHIMGFSGLLNEEFGDDLQEDGLGYVGRIRTACYRMQHQIMALLKMSRQTRGRMFWSTVNISDIAYAVTQELQVENAEQEVDVKIADNLEAFGDQRLLIVLIEHLITNAWKFSAPVEAPQIEVGCTETEGRSIFYIADNGIGFDMKRAEKLFLPFRRFHGDRFDGEGIGLATCLRIVNRHGGRIWIESEPGKGTRVQFTLS